MTDIEKMILSDAIETSIESEKTIIKLKRLLTVSLVVNLFLDVVLILRIIYG